MLLWTVKYGQISATAKGEISVIVFAKRSNIGPSLHYIIRKGK